MSIKLEWPDGKDRHFSLVKENVLFCKFTDAHDTLKEGWCRWHKRDDDGVWFVLGSSRGAGKAIAKKSFGDILDGIHMQLLAEKELLDEG